MYIICGHRIHEWMSYSCFAFCVRVSIDLAPKYRDEAPIVGNSSHSHSTARVLARWSHCAVDYIGLIVINLLVGSKSVTTKFRKIKFKKYTTPCRTQNAWDPAKRDLERARIEWDTLDFRPERERASPVRHTDWWDWSRLPFWELATSMLAHRLTPFPSQLGTIQVSWGLSLVSINYSIIYLGFVTLLELPSISLGTLASWVGY